MRPAEASKRLRPFAALWAQLETDIEALCAKANDDELAELLAATEVPTATNMWWASYEVAPLVRRIALDVRAFREARS